MELSTPRLIPVWHSCKPQPLPTSTSTSSRTRSSNSGCRMASCAMDHRRLQTRHTRPSPLCHRRDQEERQTCTERRPDKPRVPFPHRGHKRLSKPHTVGPSTAISTVRIPCKLQHHINIYNMAAQATPALRLSCKTNTSIRKRCLSVCKLCHHRHSPPQPHRAMEHKSHLHNPTTEVVWTHLRMAVIHIYRGCRTEVYRRNTSLRHQGPATMELKAIQQ